MDREWNDSQPIYRQLRDRVVALILDGVLKEGDPLPSVRTVAADYRVNPITVLKGYQELVDEDLVETRRGKSGPRQPRPAGKSAVRTVMPRSPAAQSAPKRRGGQSAALAYARRPGRMRSSQGTSG